MRELEAIESLVRLLSIGLAVGLGIWHFRRLRADLQFSSRLRFSRRWKRHYLIWLVICVGIEVGQIVAGRSLALQSLFALVFPAFVATMGAMRDEWTDKEEEKRRKKMLVKSPSDNQESF